MNLLNNNTLTLLLICTIVYVYIIIVKKITIELTIGFYVHRHIIKRPCYL